MSLALTWSLIIAPSQTLERLSRGPTEQRHVPRALLQASTAALLPILAFGCAAAAAHGRTVGSVVIALMAGTLACLGGVVLSARVARRLFGSAPYAERVACLASLPMLLGALGVALVERDLLGLAFGLTLATLAWSWRAVLLGLRAVAGSERGLARNATALALAAHAPSLLRLALWTL